MSKEIAAPLLSAESRPFWEAAKEGRLMVKKCESCGLVFWYPRSLCPDCWSDQTVWIDSKGAGTVYTYTIMRRAKVPYAVAYVTLDEGPTILSNLVTTDMSSLRVGQRVQVEFAQAVNGAAVPVFRPEGQAA